MKVVVDARLESGIPGGIEQVILGLAAGLSNEEAAGRDRYDFFVTDGGWIEGFIDPPAHVVVTPPKVRGRLARSFSRATRIVGGRGGVEMDPVLDGSGADVVHLLRQNSPATSLPTIYHPYDLQHMHLPRFFTDEERAARDDLYAAHCRRAKYVVMMTRWAKDDLCRRMDVPPEKVAVIPVPPFLRLLPTVESSEVDAVKVRLGLPNDFALFPAQTWAHKNHLTLLEALASLRESGCVVPVVCCGTQNRFFGEIERATTRLGLEDQIHHLGWVDHQTLHALYLGARCLVFPSLFEGWGMPLTEAFEVRLPVACSDRPWLPELVRGAARLFDPEQPDSVAAAIGSIWTDEDVRARLIRDGSDAVGRLRWSDVTATSIALYRAAGGLDPMKGDEQLLAAAGVTPW